MFAVFVKVELPEGGTIEQGRGILDSEVIPRVKSIPGFVTGYWLHPTAGREGLSFVIFDNEQAARGAADNVQVPEPVKLLHVEVLEVARSA